MPDPHPPLDDHAVEAAARQRFHEAMRGDKEWTWASVTEDTREAYREAERRARAAYFAALDHEASVRVVEDAIAAPGRVRNIGADETLLEAHRAKAALEALGLFTPDTEEPT